MVATPEAAHDQLAALGRLGFVGAGAAGASLALALATRGAHVAAVATHRPARAMALAERLPGCIALPDAAAVAAATDLVVLAVPDDVIAAVDASVPWRADHIVFHLSGARGAATLAHAAEHGARVAALHPLMIFPRAITTPDDALARLAGCTWALEATDDTTAARLESLVRALDGEVVRLDSTERVPYHLAAVLASNYIITLLGTAVDMWEGFGVEPERALRALLPLLRATVQNLAALGPSGALAGPVARGDAGTVAAHIGWLRAQVAAAHPDVPFDAPALLAAYRALAELTIPLARARGSLSSDAEQALLDALRGPD